MYLWPPLFNTFYIQKIQTVYNLISFQYTKISANNGYNETT